MVYSQDAGRTWEITKQLQHKQYNSEVRLIGNTVYYAGHRARLSDLAAGDGAWNAVAADGRGKLPPVAREPIDTALHCDNSKTIRE